MALYVLEPPSGTAEIACAYLGQLKLGRGFQTRGMLANSTREALWIAAPHPVFNLGLEEVGPAATFESARMTGWRYLVVSQGMAVATLELAAASRTDAPRFSRITDGRMAASLARAIANAERSPVVRRRRYALGMVRVPSIHVHALWLRNSDADGLHDLFAAIIPAPTGMPEERLLTMMEFMQLLSEAKDGVILRGKKIK